MARLGRCDHLLFQTLKSMTIAILILIFIILLYTIIRFSLPWIMDLAYNRRIAASLLVFFSLHLRVQANTCTPNQNSCSLILTPVAATMMPSCCQSMPHMDNA